MKRREFLKYSLLSVGAVSMPAMLKAAPIPRIVVVGGGFSGATCAKYLKLWGGSSVDVTVIEQNPGYVSPILSNLVLNGQKNLRDLTFGYDYFKKYQVRILNNTVAGFDTDKKRVVLEDGAEVPYDKLVLAPGIDFIYPNGYDTSKIPHAWIAGRQTVLLKKMIEGLKKGDTFVMSIPKAPYRCPPGPYERACVIADHLIRKRVGVKVVVLDENSGIIVEPGTFKKMFDRYGIDYRPNSRVVYVDDKNMSLKYEQGGKTTLLKAGGINVIPNQKAGRAVFLAGVDDGRFAPVDTLSYESLIKKDIYIIGDSQKSSQPKAGHIGNGEAKVCADAILRDLNGLKPYPRPKTNSACYSPVSAAEASWLTAVYSYDATKKDMRIMPGYPKSQRPSRKNYKDMFNWAGNLFGDTFS